MWKFQEVNVKDVSGRLVIACYLLNSLIWYVFSKTVDDHVLT